MMYRQSTTAVISKPGRIIKWGAMVMNSRDLLSILPQVASGGWTPKPEKAQGGFNQHDNADVAREGDNGQR